MNPYNKPFSERRRIIESIPQGQYCYTGAEGTDGIWRATVCPYWKRINEVRAKCKLLRVKDTNKNDLLLWDMVKLCPYKKDYRS